MDNIKDTENNNLPTFKRIPKHIGIIPDGNRRWAQTNSLEKQEGYAHGVAPGFRLYELLIHYGVQEATFYGFTKDNTKRPKAQTLAYVKACVDAVSLLSNKDANLLVIGNTNSSVFPQELKQYANKRVNFGKGLININFLVNYDWGWDLSKAAAEFAPEIAPLKPTKPTTLDRPQVLNSIESSDIAMVDFIIRWGGKMRLSGFLPVQSVYSDFYAVDEMWPDFTDQQFFQALKWYETCDVTLGG